MILRRYIKTISKREQFYFVFVFKKLILYLFLSRHFLRMQTWEKKFPCDAEQYFMSHSQTHLHSMRSCRSSANIYQSCINVDTFTWNAVASNDKRSSGFQVKDLDLSLANQGLQQHQPASPEWRNSAGLQQVLTSCLLSTSGGEVARLQPDARWARPHCRHPPPPFAHCFVRWTWEQFSKRW